MDFIDFGALIPVAAILSSFGFAWIWLRNRELRLEHRRIELQSQEDSDENRKLKQRLAVLERIVTDRGAQTAEQIEQLR